jgi:hypothetical protein
MRSGPARIFHGLLIIPGLQPGVRWRNVFGAASAVLMRRGEAVETAVVIRVFSTGLKSLSLPASFLRLRERFFHKAWAVAPREKPCAKNLKSFAGQIHLSFVKCNYRHCSITMPVVDVF